MSSTIGATKNLLVPVSRQGYLKITEIFYSLQGEARDTGWPTVFVRLTGCPLRCKYCDTEYAFHTGEWLRFEQILEQVASYKPNHVCVTGGEPLAQKRCLELLTMLCDKGYEVSLETSGAMDIAAVDSRVVKVVDFKTPDSGEQTKNLWSNLEHLGSADQIKFVICSRTDYDWVRQQIDKRDLEKRADILISPSYHDLNARKLADWVLEDRLPVRFQIQLHKELWGDIPGK